MNSDGHESNNDAPISHAFRKRQWVWAWRGASIGALIGTLMLLILVTLLETTYRSDAEGILLWLALLGAPAIILFRWILSGISWRTLDYMSEFFGGTLAIPLTWATFGFLIGFILGRSRDSKVKMS